MKKNVLFKTGVTILILIFGTACNEDKISSKECCANFDLTLSFHIEDENGNDLLNPSSERNYNDIRVFSNSELTNDITEHFLTSDTESLIVESNIGNLITIHADMTNKIDDNLFENTYYLKLTELEIDSLTLRTKSTNNGAYIVGFIYNNTIVFNNAESKSNWNNVIIK